MSDVMTAAVMVDEFLALADGRQLELVRGEVREMAPAFEPATTVAANTIALLIAHVQPRRLGRVYMDNYMDNGTFVLLEHRHSVRSPDVAFVRAAHLPTGGVRYGPVRLPPDLAVEVLSPSDTGSTLQEKLADYREAGTPLFRAIDPDTRSVTVYPHDAPPYTLRGGDTLTGDRVLPDVRCDVSELFEGVARA